MKGRKPKAPGTRQRRNKSTSAAILPPEGEARPLAVPPIPTKLGGWTDQAQQFWFQVWKSPMAARYLKADFYRLEVLCDMVDRYWRGETQLAAQIRLEGDSFATSPLARRRLEWEIRDAQAEPVAAAGGGGGGRVLPKSKPGPDPRNVLRGDFK